MCVLPALLLFALVTAEPIHRLSISRRFSADIDSRFDAFPEPSSNVLLRSLADFLQQDAKVESVQEPSVDNAIHAAPAGDSSGTIENIVSEMEPVAIDALVLDSKELSMEIPAVPAAIVLEPIEGSNVPAVESEDSKIILEVPAVEIVPEALKNVPEAVQNVPDLVSAEPVNAEATVTPESSTNEVLATTESSTVTPAVEPSEITPEFPATTLPNILEDSTASPAQLIVSDSQSMPEPEIAPAVTDLESSMPTVANDQWYFSNVPEVAEAAVLVDTHYQAPRKLVSLTAGDLESSVESLEYASQNVPSRELVELISLEEGSEMARIHARPTAHNSGIPRSSLSWLLKPGSLLDDSTKHPESSRTFATKAVRPMDLERATEEFEKVSFEKVSVGKELRHLRRHATPTTVSHHRFQNLAPSRDLTVSSSRDSLAVDKELSDAEADETAVDQTPANSNNLDYSRMSKPMQNMGMSNGIFPNGYPMSRMPSAYSDQQQPQYSGNFQGQGVFGGQQGAQFPPGMFGPTVADSNGQMFQNTAQQQGSMSPMFQNTPQRFWNVQGMMPQQGGGGGNSPQLQNFQNFPGFQNVPSGSSSQMMMMMPQFRSQLANGFQNFPTNGNDNSGSSPTATSNFPNIPGAPAGLFPPNFPIPFWNNNNAPTTAPPPENGMFQMPQMVMPQPHLALSGNWSPQPQPQPQGSSETQ